MKNKVWINTYTGKKFYPLDPKIEDICIEDIAQGLSMICRFNGQCHSFYSVAQHSVLVSYECSAENALQGLMHDTSEALGLSDLSSPIKNSGEFENYKHYEHQLQSMIYTKYGLDVVEPEDVKRADKVLLATEARDLLLHRNKDWVMPANPLPYKIEPLMPKEAKALFLKRFEELYFGDER